MKIGITTFGGDGGKSGISQYIINLIKEFCLQKSSQTQLETFIYENEESIFIPQGSDISSIRFSRSIHNPIKNIAWHQTSLPHWCKRQKLDVLFLPAANRRVSMFAACPTVGTVHDFSSIHVKGKYDPMRDFYIKKVLPFMVRRLTRVISVSESSKKDIVEFAGVPEDKVHVVYNGIDHETFFARDKDESFKIVSQQFGIDAPYILYLSRIEHPGKNHVRLIKAFEKLKTVSDIPHKLVFGGSDWSGAEVVHQIASESSFKKDIHFLGFTTKESLPLLYSGADLFVFPSLYEGFGIPVIEAMASGTPVVCSDISSIPEVAGDAGILFDPYDEQSMVDAMNRVLMDSTIKDQCIQKGFEQSRKFSWKKSAEETMKVIRMVAEGNG